MENNTMKMLLMLALGLVIGYYVAMMRTPAVTEEATSVGQEEVMTEDEAMTEGEEEGAMTEEDEVMMLEEETTTEVTY